MLGAIQVVALICILLATGGFDATESNPPTKSGSATQDAASTPVGSSAAPGASPSRDRAGSQPATRSGTPPATQSTAQPASEADQEAIRRETIARVIQGLAYLPVALLMWYAPMLAAWHGLPAGKALFFSVVAVWRNLGAFVIYGLAWLAIWMCFSLAFGLLLTSIGVANLAAVLGLPLVMLMLTWMYCSVYPSYATVFVDASAAPVPATPRVDESP